MRVEGADVRCRSHRPGHAALVGGDAGQRDRGVDRGAAGQQRPGLGRPPVVGERAEQDIRVDQVAGGQGDAGAGGEEVVAQRADQAGHPPDRRVVEDRPGPMSVTPLPLSVLETSVAGPLPLMPPWCRSAGWRRGCCW